jgi:hypothetical protein
MTAFDNPSARSFAGIMAFFIYLLAVSFHVEFIVVQAAGGLRRKTNIARIGAERLY